MAASPDPPFPHRHNRDGSWDSICRKCYLTVANAPTEAELAEPESRHKCHGFRRVLYMGRLAVLEREWKSIV